MYWAIKLFARSKVRILHMLEEQGIEIPSDWTLCVDHITLCHEKSVTPEQWNAVNTIMRNFKKTSHNFIVFAYAKNENAIAVRVDCKTLTKVPHITVAVAPGHKPVESNELTGWETFPNYGYLDGFVDVFE